MTKQSAAQATAVSTAPSDTPAQSGGVEKGAVQKDAAQAAAVQMNTTHAALRYTTLRLALFLGALVLVWGVAKVFSMDLSSQLSKLSLLAVALLLSSAVSFIVLSKQRDAMSAGLVSRSEKLSKRINTAASFEDDDDDDDDDEEE
jgi:uncharacterized protein DUF4229